MPIHSFTGARQMNADQSVVGRTAVYVARHEESQTVFFSSMSWQAWTC